MAEEGMISSAYMKYADLVDEIACMANGAKFTWSDPDKQEMRETAEKIIKLIADYYKVG
jgi:hypothetical protein